MALVPIIQPPIMKALTTRKERMIVMEQLRPVSKLEKILFPIIVTILISLLLPDAAPLVGMLMLGNLMRESGVVSRISNTAQNELMNIITIFLGVTVGATATGEVFLTPQTIGIIVLGLIAFGFGTAGGVLFGKLMCKLSGGGCFRRSDGGPCSSEGWSGGESEQLPAHARYGPERGRRYRFCCCGRRPDQYFEIIPHSVCQRLPAHKEMRVRVNFVRRMFF